MLIPSQIRSREPLQIRRSADGVISFDNAYEGDDQEFFGGRWTPIRDDGEAQEAVAFLADKVAAEPSPARPGLQETATWMREPILQGSEDELRERIEHYLADYLDPEKEADPRDVNSVYEQLKHSGSLCVSQIAIDTGLPLERVFLALRQLAMDGAVEWRPDRNRLVSLRKVFERVDVKGFLRGRTSLSGLWRQLYRAPAPSPVELIETAWSIMRIFNSKPLRIEPLKVASQNRPYAA